MNGVNVLFAINGRVVDQSNSPVPNLLLAGYVTYHYFLSGSETLGKQDLSIASDANGNYSYAFPGPGNPLQQYDQPWGIIVLIVNGAAGWKTVTPGKYNDTPTVAAPPTVNALNVSDTVVKAM